MFKSLLELSRADVARMHHAMAEKPYAANRSLAFLSKMMNRCEQRGLRPEGTNPCRHIEKFPEKRRERSLSDSELAVPGQTLTLAETDGRASPWVVAAIRLLTLTASAMPCQCAARLRVSISRLRGLWMSLVDSASQAERDAAGHGNHDPPNPGSPASMVTVTARPH